jgi:hypothetical protein
MYKLDVPKYENSMLMESGFCLDLADMHQMEAGSNIYFQA